MSFRKTIIHVYTNHYPFSFPEFVRGTLFLLNFANKNSMNVRLNIVNHAISDYVLVENYDIQDLHAPVYYEGKHLSQLIDALMEFKNSSSAVLGVTTNIGIHKNEIDAVCSVKFNSLISFTPQIQEAVRSRLTSDIFNGYRVPSITDSYNVINMYLADNRLDRAQIQSLSTQIRNSIDTSTSSIVISSSEYIRNTLSGFLGGYHVSLSVAGSPRSPLEDSIIDFLIISKSRRIYTFSEYNARLKRAAYNVRETTSLSVIELSEPYNITDTFGGTLRGDALIDGPLSSALFSFPSGLTEDIYENIFIADTMNNAIRQISPQGIVTTVAGSLVQESGIADGPGEDARFFGPTGVAVDASGYIYVVDAINGLIRKIRPDGVVTTLAGSTAGFRDGTGSNAQFNFLYGPGIQ